MRLRKSVLSYAHRRQLLITDSRTGATAAAHTADAVGTGMICGRLLFSYDGFTQVQVLATLPAIILIRYDGCSD